MKQVQKTEVVVCQFFSSGSVSLPIASSQLSRNLAFTDQENQKAIFLQTRESKKWRRFGKKFQFYLFLERVETEIVYGRFYAQYEWEEESLTVLQIYLFYNLSLTKTWNYNNIMNTNIFLKPIWTIKSASMHSPNFLRSTYWNLSWATNFILRMNVFFPNVSTVILVLADPKLRMKTCCSFLAILTLTSTMYDLYVVVSFYRQVMTAIML